MSDEKVEIEDCNVRKETEKAILVERLICDSGEDAKREFWVPKSVIDEDSEIWKKDDVGTIVLPAWFCEREGIEP